MSFSSLHFLFLFLPVFLFLYFIIPVRRWRNLILLFGSLVFYAWGSPKYLIFLILSILFIWLFSLLIEYLNAREKNNWAKLALVIAVSGNLLVLIVYKYLGFIFDTVNTLFHTDLTPHSLPLPLGISFFTFTATPYLVDVFRRHGMVNRNLFQVANYLAMFPKLVQGPISRYGQLGSEFAQRRASTADIADGIRRFIFGLAKKVLIADNLALVADKVFSGNFDLIGADLAWYGLIAYSLQIYFDFCGYMDMAIGLGKILGFSLPENFNYPYISRSISDFWRRWHMSLTAFFRDYVFLPLEMARRQDRYLRQQSNLIIVFLLTGLWHGASWNYVLWGAYFGLLLAMEASGLGKLLKKIPVFLQHLYSILLILLGWVFFRIGDIGQWGAFFTALFGGNGWIGRLTMKGLNIYLIWPLLAFGMILSTPILARFWEGVRTRRIFLLLTDFLLLLMFILSVAFLVANGYEAFMYAQF